MLRLIIKKIGEIIPVLLLVSIGAAALADLIPGSPSRYILGEFATEEKVAALDEQLGLNKPFAERYLDWLGRALRGDLGESAVAAAPVTERLLDALPATLELAVLTLVLSLLMAIPAATLTAARSESRFDRGISNLASVFQAMPSFVAAVFFAQLLSVNAGLLPSFGWVDVEEGLGENLRHAVLPVLVLLSVTTPMFYRVLRADMLGVLQQDFVLSAKSRGLPDRYILVRHVLRPASLSLLTLTGLIFGYLIGGSIIVETFFGVPGLGSLVARSISAKDIVVVQGVVLYVALAYLILNLIVDLLQLVIDPEVRS